MSRRIIASLRFGCGTGGAEGRFGAVLGGASVDSSVARLCVPDLGRGRGQDRPVRLDGEHRY